jgi:hypothetical protein
MIKQVYSKKEARELIRGGIGETKFDELVKGKKLSVIRNGRIVFVTAADIARHNEEFINSCRQTQDKALTGAN